MLFSYLEERLYIAARLTACPNFSLAACTRVTKSVTPLQQENIDRR